MERSGKSGSVAVRALAGEIEYRLENYSLALAHLKLALGQINERPGYWEGKEQALRVRSYWHACSARKG